MTLNAKIKIF